MDKGDAISFKYDVQIPQGIDYENVSYSQHAVFFNLDTQEGKLADYTEPNKLGLKITRKFDLEIEKNKLGTETKVQNALYLLEAGAKGDVNYESYIELTDANGKINLEDLYVGKVYKLTEIKTTDEYELSTGVLEFKIVENEQTQALEVEVLTQGAGYKLNSVDEDIVKINVQDRVRYDINITKYRTGTTTKVKDATYLITTGTKGEVDYEIYRKSTNEEGLINLDNLYLDKIYTVEEIGTPDSLVMAEGKLQFKVAQSEENGELSVEILEQGAGYKTYEINQEQELVNFKVEDEVNYKLILNKKDSANKQNLGGVKYQITGENINETVLTNSEGKIEISNLKIGKTYTVTEVSAKGYYLNEPFEICVTKNDNGNLETNVGTITDNKLDVKLNVDVTNEKIPTYRLELTKVEKGNKDKKLSGVTFVIKGKDLEQELTTDENGTISLNGLYQYVDGKEEVDGIYTIQEKIPADGYILSSEILKIQITKENNTLKVNILEGADLVFDNKTEKDIEISGNTVKITLQNSPVFKIKKLDSNSSNILIADAKFAIYKIVYDENNTLQSIQPAKDVNGNIIGVEETINGKIYNIVTTNENGEIILDLPEGFYYLEEIQPAEGYVLPENAEDRIHYFGIGAKKEGIRGLKLSQNSYLETTIGAYNDIVELDDGYIVVGQTLEEVTITLQDGTNQTINGGFIIKYNKEFSKVIWCNSLGVDTALYDIVVTSEGDYITIGYDESSKIVKYNQSGALVYSKDILSEENLSSFSIQNEIVKTDKGVKIFGADLFFVDAEVVVSITTLEQGEIVLTEGDFVIELDNEGNILSYYGSQSSEFEQEYKEYETELIKKNYYTGIYHYNTESTITTENQGNINVLGSTVIELDENGNYKWARSNFDQNIQFYDAAKTTDGGVIATGVVYIDLTLEDNGKQWELINGGLTIKFDEHGNIEDVISGYSPIVNQEIFENAEGKYVTVGSLYVNGNPFVGVIEQGIINPEFPKLQEIVVENTKKTLRITTEVRKGEGTISGQGQTPYETVIYGNDSILPIVADPADGWTVNRITINGREVDYEIAEDGTVTLEKFTKMKEDKHIVVWFVNPDDDYNLDITKTDENGNPLAGAKFTIEKVVRDSKGNETLEEVKDLDGNIVGELENIDGEELLVVTSDVNGKIKLNLEYGNYRLIEVLGPVGYKVKNNKPYEVSIAKEIYYIEDLIEFSEDVNSGNSYSAKLARSLDFNDETSYREPSNKGKLTFTPIGTSNCPFTSVFDGQGNVICNVTVNIVSSSVGFFSNIKNANIINLGIESGNFKTGGLHSVGGIVGVANDSIISNCFNKSTVTNIGGRNSGSSQVLSQCGGIVGLAQNSQIINCCNYGNVKFSGQILRYDMSIGGIAGKAIESEILNCCNFGNIVYNNTSSTGSLYNTIREGGIIGNANTVRLNNCYSVMEIIHTYEAKTTYAGSIIGSSSDNTVNNCYYNINDELTGISGQEDVIGIVEAKELEYMKSIKFAELLNSNINSIETSEKLIKWIYYDDEYPKLKTDIIENNEHRLTIVNEILNSGYNFEVIKTNTNGTPLANAKFTLKKIITNEDGTQKFENAKDINGNIMGTKENINGENILVVTSDNEGRIKYNLEPGTYQLIEVQAPAGYKIQENNIYEIHIENATIEINSIEDLIELSNNVNSGNTYEGKTIELVRTLDFDDDNSYNNPNDTSYGDYNKDGKEEGIKAEITKGYGFIPIGSTNSTYCFSGTFEGNGYEIKNIYVSNSVYYTYVGLFGYAKDAKINNLTISGIINNTYNNATCIGGIVAQAENTRISNCNNEINLFNSRTNNNIQQYIGGVVGYSIDSDILLCKNKGRIFAEYGEYIGGIVGKIEDGIIENCINMGNYSGNSGRYMAGIAGSSKNSKINRCSNIGNGSSTSTISAGIVEESYNSLILNCYNAGSQTSPVSSGIVNYIYDNTSVINCYNVGTIEGSAYTAGISSNANSGNVYNCYNTGKILGGQDKYTGGLIAVCNDTMNIENCYYINNVEKAFGTNDGAQVNNVLSVDDSQLKSKEFVDTLNNNISLINQNNIEIQLEKWKYNEDFYPSLEDNTSKTIYKSKVGVILNIENNTEKYYQITTEVKQGKGSVLGEGQTPYEKVKENEDSIKEITAIPDNDNWKVTKITVNGVDTKYQISDNGSVTLPKFTKMNENKHVVVYFGKKSNFELIKTDENGKTVEGAKFTIKQMFEQQNGSVQLANAKDTNGNIVGTLEKIDGNKIYVVTSDNNGRITVNLAVGKYQIKEVQAPNGYALGNGYEEEFEITKDGTIKNVYSTTGVYAKYKSTSPTSDGGYITQDGQNITKYSIENRQMWSINVGATSGTNIKEIKSKDYIVAYRINKSITLSKDIIKDATEDVTIGEDGTITGIILRISTEGYITNVIQIKGYGEGYPYIEAQSDGSYIIGDNIAATLNFSSEQTESGTAISKTTGTSQTVFMHFSADDKVKSVFTINTNKYINSVKYIDEVYNIAFRQGNYGSSATGTLIINLDKQGNVLKSFEISVPNNNIVINNGSRLSNGGYIVCGSIYGTAKIQGSYTQNGKDIIIGNSGYQRGIVIIYDANHKIKSVTVMEGKSHTIYDVAEASPGNYIAIGINSNMWKVTEEQGYDGYTHPEETTNKGFILHLNEDGKIVQAISDKSYATDVEICGDSIMVNGEVGYLLNSDTSVSSINLEVVNKKLEKIIVHHYLKKQDGTYTTIKVAEDNTLYGEINESYITQPQKDIKGIELEKDENNNYIIPSNATGKYTEEVQEIIYYYEPKDVNLTVHHYLEGTEVQLAEDEKYTFESEVIIKEDGTYEIVAEGSFDVDSNNNYKELKEDYIFTRIISDVKEDTKLEDNLTFTEDKEVTYYYTQEDYQITTEVKKHTEQRTDEQSKEKIELEIEGGKITGEFTDMYKQEYGVKFVETVLENKNSKTTIIAEPDLNYTVKQIKLVSTSNSGEQTETIIYGENSVQNAEISYTENSDGTISLTTFNNVKENKHIIVEFAPILGQVIVHHYVAGTGEEFNKEAIKVPLQNGGIAEDELKQDFIGEKFATKPIENVELVYELVSTSQITSGEYTQAIQHVYYYYDYKNYEYRVEYYYENKEIEETDKYEKDEDATVYSEAKYNSVIDTYEDKIKTGYELDKVENKPITITDNPENNVIKVYYGLSDYAYKVEYYYDNIIDEEKTDDFTAEYQDKIINYKDKVKTGYRLDKVEPVNNAGELELTISDNPDNNIIKVYYVKDDFGYTIEYYYDGVINDAKTESGKAKYQEIISTYPDKIEEGYILTEEKNLPLTISDDAERNVIKIYYRTQYNITTEVLTHTEEYVDGTIVKNVKGGKIDGDGLDSYEKVLKYDDSTKSITINPDNDYEIVQITIKHGDNSELEVLDYSSMMDGEGTVTIPQAYFTGMESDKHIQVEFRKKSNVIVKYLEKTKEGYTEIELLPQDEIIGYETKEYETTRKNVLNYRAVEDQDGNIIPSNSEGTMKADTIEVIYYYEKIPAGMIVKHLEKIVNEDGTVEGIAIEGIEDEYIDGALGEDYLTTRKTIEDYIPAEAPELDNEMENIVYVDGTETEKEVTFEENVIEVVYWYEKQFYITTEVIPHIEKDEEGNEVSEKGGSISGDITEKSDEDSSENLPGGDSSEDDNISEENPNENIPSKEDKAYEIVIRAHDNTKPIEIKPKDGYRIKKLIINNKVIYIKDIEQKDYTITLPKAYFKNVQEDKHIQVEFERIPSKLIVKYVDVDTKEEILTTEITEGFVNDEYETQRKEIENYIPANPEPENTKGKLVEDEVTVIYYYTKQFKITTDVIEHYEFEEQKVVDVVVSKEDDKDDEHDNDDNTNIDSGIDKDNQNINNSGNMENTENLGNKEETEDKENSKNPGGKILVKGGKISGEDEKPYEIVNRGLDNKNEIKIIPDDGYRIKYVKIKAVGQEIEELNLEELVQKDKSITLSSGYFKNMQSDKHIIVEFERIPSKVIANYLNINTNENVAKCETGFGFKYNEYKTYEKQIPYYEFLKDKYPENSQGKLGEEDTVVNYWYRKLLFNMAITKEFSSIQVNGVEKLKQDKKFVKVDITNTEVDNTNILVKYNITVNNNQEVAGKAKIVEQLPIGFKLSEQMKLASNEIENEWTLVDGNIELTTKELQPGEKAEYEVILEWDKELKCLGELENIVRITETENIPKYNETTLEDNKDSCTLILAIRTRENRDVKTIISMLCFILAGICSVVYVVTEIYDRKKNK